MIDVEPLIVSELERMLPLPDAGRADWGDVLRRAGIGARHRRLSAGRRTILALVAAVGVICVTAAAIPAFGLTHTVINWFSAPAAPQPMQKLFASLDVGAPAGMAPGVSGAARLVMSTQVAGNEVHFWVARTRRGGFCFELESYGGTCDRSRSLAVNPIIGERHVPGTVVLYGDALSSETNHMVLRYADGESVSIPVVYVSKPIDAGFFIYEITASKNTPAIWPATLTAVRADGSPIGSKAIPGFLIPTGGPPTQ